MAKKENTVPVTGGLEFGKYNTIKPEETMPQTPEQQVPAPVIVSPVVPAKETVVPETKGKDAGPEPDDLASYYRFEFGLGRKYEKVNIRKQFTITPTLNKQLNSALRHGEIKSANSLVNFLLEKWFAGEITFKK